MLVINPNLAPNMIFFIYKLNRKKQLLHNKGLRTFLKSNFLFQFLKDKNWDLSEFYFMHPKFLLILLLRVNCKPMNNDAFKKQHKYCKMTIILFHFNVAMGATYLFISTWANAQSTGTVQQDLAIPVHNTDDWKHMMWTIKPEMHTKVITSKMEK